jgi:uncharacterized protein GlcG (DUF336 family)
MKTLNNPLHACTFGVLLLGSVSLVAVVAPTDALAEVDCSSAHGTLQSVLDSVVTAGGNGGFGNDMWATVVDRDGRVCAVVFSGDDRASQWPGSRVISAQKASTANAFSLPGFYPNVGLGRALSTGNLYGLVLPGGSLYGLQHSNPVDTAVAYGNQSHSGGNPGRYGQPNDPLVGDFVGGVNVFGGGLALYDASGQLVGALGVSGDTSCTDHIIAWKVRDALELDNIPGGVGDGGTTDNLILADPATANTFEHPICGFDEDSIIPALATNFPIGPNP